MDAKEVVHVCEVVPDGCCVRDAEGKGLGVALGLSVVLALPDRDADAT